MSEPQTCPPPSLAIYSDKLFLDELYRRVALNKLRLEATRSGEGWVEVRAVVGASLGEYAATFMAYAPSPKHFNGGCCSSGADACESSVEPV